jgi:ribosome assembly protein YihI (activator of Der GTPase)
MPLTHQDKSYVFAYEMMNKGEQALVDTAFKAVAELMREWGIAPAADDRAEALVGAIARFVNESRVDPEQQNAKGLPVT